MWRILCCSFFLFMWIDRLIFEATYWRALLWKLSPWVDLNIACKYLPSRLWTSGHTSGFTDLEYNYSLSNYLQTVSIHGTGFIWSLQGTILGSLFPLKSPETLKQGGCIVQWDYTVCNEEHAWRVLSILSWWNSPPAASGNPSKGAELTFSFLEHHLK